MGKQDMGTRTAIQALVGTLGDDKLRARLERALSGEAAEQERQGGGIRPLVVDGREASKMLGVTVRCVRSWAKQGLLRRVVLPGATRAFGYAVDSIEALANGEVAS